jgi:NAD(P)-dependent dehydrogenase (short-subunit alcohol dehydrogenase family)
MKLELPVNPSFPFLQRDFPTKPDSGEKSYKGRGRLHGRRALITGGDSGIGRAVVIAMAREGAKVAINYLPEEQPDADDVYNLLAKEGIKIVLLPGNLLDEQFCGELVSKAEQALGGLDILVNNAGWVTFAPILSAG